MFMLCGIVCLMSLIFRITSAIPDLTLLLESSNTTKENVNAKCVVGGKALDAGNLSKCTDNLQTDIDENNIVISSGQHEANISLHNTDNVTCTPAVYKATLTSINVTQDLTKSIKGLMPNVDYQIVIANDLTNKTIKKSFKTKPKEPKVSNLKYYEYSNHSVILFWSTSEPDQGNVTYNITYKFMGYIACNSTNSEEKPFTLTKHGNSVVLEHLRVYSKYTVTVVPANEIDYEQPISIEIETKESGDLKEELPPAITVQKEDIVIATPDCKKVKGPLKYYLKYTYSDAQACVNKSQPAYTEKVNYNNGLINISAPDKLIPFSHYTVEIGSKRNGKTVVYENDLKILTKPASPTKVRNLTAYSKNESHIWLKWKSPCPTYGEIEDYAIDAGQHLYSLSQLQTPCIWKGFYCSLISGLEKDRRYTFTISAKNKDVANYGESSLISVKAAEEEPHPPENLRYSFNARQLYLSWQHPSITNGPLREFSINGTVLDTAISGENIFETYSIQVDQLNYTEKVNVTPATVYNITVRAVNSIAGKPTSIEVIAPPPAPELSAPPSFVNSCSEGSCSINIPPVSTCVNCTLYVVVTHKENISTVSPFKIETLYKNLLENEENKVMLMYDHWIAESIKFNDRNENSGRFLSLGKTKEQIPVLNDSSYLISLVVVSEYKGTYNTRTYHLDYSKLEASNENFLYSLLLLLIIPLAVMSFLLYRVYRKKQEKSEKSNLSSAMRIATNDMPAPFIEEHSIPLVPFPPKITYSRKIGVKNLKSYLEEAAEGGINNSELSRQHKMFTQGYTKSIEIGSMEINKTKNRYRNIVAYDHSRVKLKYPDANGSDYINANYINGYKIKKAYIATQGPKLSTLNDFWYMIWEQNVHNIIMLANIFENGKKKCEEYWPALSETKGFNDILVENIKTTVYPSYTYREFQVTYEENQRTIIHLHFTVWPDHGVPLYPQNLVPFMGQMLRIKQGKDPIVVHCSAGIGRTGTILLCDIALRMVALEQNVDFLKILYELRQQRANMVDNVSQYVLAHLVVYECLLGRDFSVPLGDQFKNKIELMLQDDITINSIISYLKDISWQMKIMQECFETNMVHVNKSKNRFSNILPGYYQVYLDRYPINDSNSDYINAVTIDGFQNESGYVVTQQPLPNTVRDFWRLILQYNVSTIVSLNEILKKDKTSCIFWPRKNQTLCPVEYISLTHISEEERKGFTTIRIALDDKTQDRKKCINFIKVNGWTPDMTIPPDLSEILAVREHIFNSTIGDESSIVITCYDGATACGLFVGLSILIERMKLEQLCDVVLAVNSVRQKRIQCFQDKEQFKFLLKAALQYFQSFDLYANFDN